MDFRVLGSLEIWEGSSQIEISGAKRRAVLALLVLHANEVVGKDRLIEDLWGENAPRNAAASLHNHISRLRKALGPDCLVTRAWGYVLRIDPDQVDLRRFERLIADAEPLPARERSATLAEALALWRGPALADLVFEPSLEKEIARLEELRLAVFEARLDADLELGRNTGIIGELEALIAEHPLRERLRGQLILALYRDGRQAEALEVYRETRRLLADELGLEPSPQLRDLERAILRQDPSLASTPGSEEPIEAEPGRSRWRWPRSPLVALAALALLAVAGVASAIIATHGGAPHGRRATPAAGAAPLSPQTSSSTSKEGHAAPATSAPKPDTAATKNGKSSRTSANAGQSSAGARTNRAQATIEAKLATTKGSQSSSTRRRPHQPPARINRTRQHSWSSSRAGQRAAGRPKTSTSRRSKPAPSVTSVYRLADNFTDPAFTSSRWNLNSFGTGVSAAEQKGRLEFSITPDVVFDDGVNTVDQHYGTNCYLKGNFDARIRFRLLSWPKRDGVLVSFGVYFAPPHEAFWSISRTGALDWRSEGYYSWLDDSPGFAPAADRSGVLRLRRQNGVLTVYYRDRRGWAMLDAGDAVGPASLVVMLAAHPDDFGHQAASAAFDRFQATATSVNCPPGTPLPPRRSRRIES